MGWPCAARGRRVVGPYVGEGSPPVAAPPVSRRGDAEPVRPDAGLVRRAVGEPRGRVFAALALPHGYPKQVKR
jgi:hypothetical protein